MVTYSLAQLRTFTRREWLFSSYAVLSRPSDKWSYWLLSIAFAISRLLYYAAGVRFDVRPLHNYFQIIEPDLLKNRLVESLLYCYTQPPGFNLLIGVILKLFPQSYPAALHATYLGCGLIITLSLYRLIRVCRVLPGIAFFFALVFSVSPGVALYENYLLYDYLIACLLCIAALTLYEFFKQHNDWYGVAFLASVVALLMIRNQFHLIYLIAAVSAIWYFAVNRRRVFIAGSLLLAVALSVYVKNFVLFRRFESSTWLGITMAAITIHQLTQEELQSGISRGILSPAASIPVDDPLQAYKPYIRMPEKTGIPVLDREVKAGGATNFNNLGYLQVQQLYMKDGLAVLRNFPAAYLRSLSIAWFTYFLPPGDFLFFGENRSRIMKVERLFDVCVYGQLRDASDRKNLRALRSKGSSVSLLLYTGVFLLVGIPLLWVFGTWHLIRNVRTGSATPAVIALLSFILINIAYVTLTSNFLSSFENNRYRFPIDSFYVLLTAMAANAVLRRGYLRQAPLPSDHAAGAAFEGAGTGAPSGGL